MHLSVLLELL
jgi:hypothetical protein